jgi:hypothetical protein
MLKKCNNIPPSIPCTRLGAPADVTRNVNMVWSLSRTNEEFLSHLYTQNYPKLCNCVY